MVVADDKCWMSPDSALFHVLDTDVPGLPQAERSFRISRVRPDFFDRSVRLFRNIIIVDIQDIYTQPKFKYTRDAYSSPQMIMTIQAPNQKEFADYVSKNGQVIIDFFTRAEMNRQVKLLEKNTMKHFRPRYRVCLIATSGCRWKWSRTSRVRISCGLRAT